jgi:hypothetical protein
VKRADDRIGEPSSALERSPAECGHRGLVASGIAVCRRASIRWLRQVALFAGIACILIGLGVATSASSQEISSPQQPSNQGTTQPVERNYFQRYAAFCETKPTIENEKWLHNFWCEIKIGEAIIAAFTILLVIVTACLVAVGFVQGVIMWRTIKHSREADRAHVSGGANRASADGSFVLVVTINNLGKTQAFIGTVAATVCKEDELAAFPGWAIQQWKGYILGQIVGGKTDVFLPHEAEKVIVGRIWYRDIFRKHRSVGFVLKTDDLTAVGGRDASAHWQERPEKNLGPAEPRL